MGLMPGKGDANLSRLGKLKLKCQNTFPLSLLCLTPLEDRCPWSSGGIMRVVLPPGKISKVSALWYPNSHVVPQPTVRFSSILIG